MMNSLKRIRSGIILALGITVVFNMMLLQVTNAGMVVHSNMQTQNALAAYISQPATDDVIAATFEVIKPKGVPAIYGAELGISFDDPVAAMDVMRQYDPNKDVSIMDEGVLARYIRIGLMISCEYCCSADTMVFDNGVAACGCAHSKAMRGLTRYMLEAYPSVTDDQILEEHVKWKTLYFPSDSSQKALELTKAGSFNPATFLINNAAQ